MARPKRINLPHALYHVLCRSISGELAFRDRLDETKFLEYLARFLPIYEFRMHAFCLMKNHFHLILESGRMPALSELMGRLLTAYSVYYNTRHKRHGPIFQGRFKSFVVDKSNYLLALSRYIHLNPAAGKKNDYAVCEKYRGSSLRYYVKGGEPEYLRTTEILSWFQGDRDKYREFIRKGLDEESKPLVWSVRFLGSEGFRKRTARRIKRMESGGGRSERAESQRRKRRVAEDEKIADSILKTVADYFKLRPEIVRNGFRAKGNVGRARTLAIGLMREQLPWTAKKIGDYFGVGCSISRQFKKLEKSEDLKRDFERLKEVYTRG